MIMQAQNNQPRRRLLPCAALAAALLLAPLHMTFADEAATEGDAAREAERYRLLVERNIFSPTRGPRPQAQPREQPRSSTPPPREVAPPDPGRSVVLRGIGQRGEDVMALFEAGDGTLHRVGVGDTVSGRRITDITLDQVRFEHESQRQAISAGMTLTGEVAAPPERPVASHDSAGSGSGGGNGSSETDTQRMRELMRQRRAQLLGTRPSSPENASPQPPSEGASQAREMPAAGEQATPSPAPPADAPAMFDVLPWVPPDSERPPAPSSNNGAGDSTFSPDSIEDPAGDGEPDRLRDQPGHRTEPANGDAAESDTRRNNGHWADDDTAAPAADDHPDHP